MHLHGLSPFAHTHAQTCFDDRDDTVLTTSCLSVICSTSTSSSIKPLYSILLADSWSALEYTAWEGTQHNVSICYSQNLLLTMGLGWDYVLTKYRNGMQAGLYSL